jgi:hypothetical protein
MTKHIHMSPPKYAARKGKNVPVLIVMLIGACAAWFGLSGQSMDQSQIPQVAQAILTELQQEISYGISKAHEPISRLF